MSYDESLPVDEIAKGVNSLDDSNERVLESVLKFLIVACSPSSSLVTANGSTLGLVISH